MTDKELKEIQERLTRIRAIASLPRYPGQKPDTIRECEYSLAHYHGLRHLEPPEPEPNWKRFMPSFGWWDKFRGQTIETLPLTK